MIPYGILAPNRVGTHENADWPLRPDRRFRFVSLSARITTTSDFVSKVQFNLDPALPFVVRHGSALP